MMSSYSFGRDVVNAGPSPAGTNCAGENGADTAACREWSALVKYDAGPWGAALAVDTLKGGTGAFAGPTSSTKSDRRIVANGYVMLGQAKVAGGLIRRDNDRSAATPKSDLWFVGAAYPVTPQFTVDGELYRLSFKNSANNAKLFAIRGTYSLSKRSAVYATAGNISNSGALALSVSGGAPGSNPLPGASQTGLMVGLRHTF